MKTRAWLVAIGFLILALLLSWGAAPCDARGGGSGHGGHGGGWHGGGSHGGGHHGGGHHGGHGGSKHGGWHHGGTFGGAGWVGGVVIGSFPLWYPYYPYSYAPAYGNDYPQAGQEWPVYIQREPPAEYWYYCWDPQGYYPYVPECPGGWVKVAPQPNPGPSP